MSSIAWNGENITPNQKVSDQLPKEIGPNRGHLLIVDDEAIIRNFLAQSLENRSFIVDLAEETEFAWRRLQTTKYDCILLDLNVPTMGGRELYRLIKAFDDFLGDTVIFMSGDTVSSGSRDFLSTTGNFVLSKPFELNDLYSRINEVLTRIVRVDNYQTASA